MTTSREGTGHVNAGAAAGCAPSGALPQIAARDGWSPPEWALMQRLLLETLNDAAAEFVRRYTYPDGTLIWRDNWPGMDGSDDPYEAFMNLALLYALGGSEEVHALALNMWDAITWQWTQYGQIYNEFDRYYDWMHHGEGYLYLYFLGLTDPHLPKQVQRSVRFAGMYTGDDPEADNYDKEKKLIRSPITGSKGPRFTMTEEDWCTHRGVLDDYLAPFEDIPGVDFASGKCPWSDDNVYREIIRLMNERMARGDVPLNLNATSLVTHAFMMTGEERFRGWVLTYYAAWEERAARNGGIMPDNVGLSGEIGEYMDGKWWGGYYGWRWPHGFMTVIEPLTNAAMNAALLTGDMSRLGEARRQLDLNWSLGKREDGVWVVPHRHFDAGWTDYRQPDPKYAIYLWTVSMAEEDRERANRIEAAAHFREVDVPAVSGRNPATGKETKHFIGNTYPWFRYMQGLAPDYPGQALHAGYRLIRQQLEKMRSDAGNPRSWNYGAYNTDDLSSIHFWQEYCPLYFESLVQLTWGAPMHISHGGLQHARLRYFDADGRRPGLPEQVGALVEALTEDGATVTLVNVGLTAERTVIVQAGGFGEHRFEQAVCYNERGERTAVVPIGSRWLEVKLAPGSGVRLELTMLRYVNAPTYATPWTAEADRAPVLRGRSE
ncbi:hypothetical protein SK3146_00340 [Paenibacillus konkukensis]|uniref:Linalool dehydratase/isomerase domain-containing protein n=1 Tax=Paenibacillus konkukensis TaxID=2020716 RepID=A0ABY4RHT9_9BACL|nr:hypothetical protein [Paenibacillus doosanensis]UQZ81184.1 hypothetical protein SK3146_00340 [Paenibacillus konkukensis]